MMNFYQLNALVENDKIVQDWLENFTEAVVAPPQNQAFMQQRQKGILEPHDPLNQYKADDDVAAGNINIVWITGMWSGWWPGTTGYSQLLKSLGYNVQVVRTAADIKAAGLGRIARHWGPGSRLGGMIGGSEFMQNLHQKIGSQHVAKNQEIVSKELGDTAPDLIIGSSQGGAIAISVAPNYKRTPMLLLCPAWKIFHVTPTYLNPQSIVIHGKFDRVVPLEDSVELADAWKLQLIVTQDGHLISNGFNKVIQALQSLSGMVARFKSKQHHESCGEERINLWIA